MSILSDPSYVVVPPGPGGPVGTVAWLRGAVSRFCDGPEWERRRAWIEARLAGLDLAPGPPVRALAVALGFSSPDRVEALVPVVAGAYQPGTWQGGADEAVAELVRLAPPEWPALDVQLLVQAYAPVAALIASGGDLSVPPVPSTRRVGPHGEVVVALDGIPFGEGPRACPGREVALALVAGALAGP